MKNLPRILRTIQSLFLYSLVIGLSSLAFATDWNVALVTKENCSFSNVTTEDQQIVVRNVGGWFKLDITALTSLLPEETHIDALDYLDGPPNPRIVFSLAEDAVLPGAGLVADEDLLLWNGSAISMLWDGTAKGLFSEMDIDAVDIISLGAVTSFSFSLSAAGTLPTVGLVQKSDVIRWTSGIGYLATKDFDGTTLLPAEVNIDGFSRETTTGILIFSTDIQTQLGGTWYEKSDLIDYISPATFAMRFDASSFGVSPEVNIDSVETKQTEIPVNLSRFIVE